MAYIRIHTHVHTYKHTHDGNCDQPTKQARKPLQELQSSSRVLLCSDAEEEGQEACSQAVLPAVLAHFLSAVSHPHTHTHIIGAHACAQKYIRAHTDTHNANVTATKPQAGRQKKIHGSCRAALDTDRHRHTHTHTHTHTHMVDVAGHSKRQPECTRSRQVQSRTITHTHTHTHTHMLRTAK